MYLFRILTLTLTNGFSGADDCWTGSNRSENTQNHAFQVIRAPQQSVKIVDLQFQD
jgi:hypothetical protein